MTRFEIMLKSHFATPGSIEKYPMFVSKTLAKSHFAFSAPTTPNYSFFILTTLAATLGLYLFSTAKFPCPYIRQTFIAYLPKIHPASTTNTSPAQERNRLQHDAQSRLEERRERREKIE
jgi:hypothetical protein